MNKVTLITTSLLFAASPANAAPGSLINPLSGVPYLATECNQDIQVIDRETPKSFKFKSACALEAENPKTGLSPYRPRKNEIVSLHKVQGTYFFEGNSVLSGKLMYYEDEYIGTRLEFIPLNESKELPQLKFMNSEGTAKNFGFKELSEKNTCWTANAKLQIRLVAERVSENDDSGLYAAGFNKLQLSAIGPCR